MVLWMAKACLGNTRETKDTKKGVKGEYRFQIETRRTNIGERKDGTVASLFPELPCTRQRVV